MCGGGVIQEGSQSALAYAPAIAERDGDMEIEHGIPTPPKQDQSTTASDNQGTGDGAATSNAWTVDAGSWSRTFHQG